MGKKMPQTPDGYTERPILVFFRAPITKVYRECQQIGRASSGILEISINYGHYPHMPYGPQMFPVTSLPILHLQSLNYLACLQGPWVTCPPGCPTSSPTTPSPPSSTASQGISLFLEHAETVLTQGICNCLSFYLDHYSPWILMYLAPCHICQLKCHLLTDTSDHSV